MNKHTPGPWRVAPAFAHWALKGPSNETIARIDAGTLPTNDDARLLAAAPDLLAALERLVHPMADDSDIENALAAIAKARGEA